MNCDECGQSYGSLRALRQHHREEHAGEIATPDEYLGPVESEQRDFDGDEPDESEHNPVYLAENETPDLKYRSLYAFEGDGDDE